MGKIVSLKIYGLEIHFRLKVDHAESFQVEIKLTEWWTITRVAIACSAH